MLFFCVVEFFVRGTHVRWLKFFGLCATVDALIVAFHTSDGWTRTAVLGLWEGLSHSASLRSIVTVLKSHFASLRSIVTVLKVVGALNDDSNYNFCF